MKLLIRLTFPLLGSFIPEEVSDWFKELTEDYILGNVTFEAATQKALELIKNGKG